MSAQLSAFNKTSTTHLVNEPDVEVFANSFLTKLGFTLKHRKTGNKDLDRHWPSKTVAAKSPGAPDILVYAEVEHALPFCVWENKGPAEHIDVALNDAKFYIEGLHRAQPGKAGLPRLAAGFNGKLLRLAYLNHNLRWFPVRVDGVEVVDAFLVPKYAAIGFASNGNFLAAKGHATAVDLRNVLPSLKNIYRSVSSLKSGRRPIDFTIAMLTLRMLCEMLPDWGSWAEQPGLVRDAASTDHALKERFATMVSRVLENKSLKSRYGDIFEFSEKSTGANEETAFSFTECLRQIEAGQGFYEQAYTLIDTLPPLHGAEFDVFGEVYQAIGDDATKKSLGEFFTGRHIISAFIPLLFHRAGITSFEGSLVGKTIADIACGTGGFLTETLRHVKSRFKPDDVALREFAKKAFFGYDLSQSNASRARVNMYFAGDGFSTITGGIDSLRPERLENQPSRGFDLMLANPPYGQRLEEKFLSRILGLLKPDGWGMVVLPTGVLENPRSSSARLELFKLATVTDVVALPPHAFAPYTKQRTAIVLFQKRATPLAGQNWNDVAAEIATEEVSMFIVDNDGFANSDKRYETPLKATTGEWLHDDLKPWVHATNGEKRDSKMLAALLKKQAPKNAIDEFGNPLGKKHGIFTIKRLRTLSQRGGADGERGLAILPDSALRPARLSMELSEFSAKCKHIQSLVSGKIAQAFAGPALSDLIREAMSYPVTGGSISSGKKVEQLFTFKKGDPALTEAVIYAQQDSNGLLVYGGGESLPRFKIKNSSKTKGGITVKVHKAPALVVAMDGSSGSVRVIEAGEFICNHHACVLTPKPNLDLNLYTVAQQLEGGLRAISSNKDGSATLTRPAVEGFKVALPTDTSEAEEIATNRKQLAALRDRIFGA